ncbi:MAG: dihydrofolate reductase [Flavobacteriales bacterium]|nr:dihydrofolate reductase [Flavobacteriales bacterium]
MIVSAIAAVAENGVIGRDGDLPWHLPDDLRFFQQTTRGHHVITGRKNYESIPLKYRPLKDRVNIVVTRSRGYEAPGAVVVHTLEDALAHARLHGETEAFIIGGGQVYREAFDRKLLDRIYLTRVHAQVEGDTSFPVIEGGAWSEILREEHPADERHAHAFSIVILERI